MFLTHYSSPLRIPAHHRIEKWIHHFLPDKESDVFAINVLKTLFMIKYVLEIEANIDYMRLRRDGEGEE